ncbi:MAG: acyl-ACP--UDP-N-acetylglucosamine O-acyltransferase [Rikenellaceae bacterium]|nr:acyl-ACP--UDP-N-acetylglucosamine O-acyltransferase [Rikenellaceae bacterium]
MISKLAHIHPDAKLGNNVTVEPFAYIAGDVTIGDDCWIGPGAVIYDGARIGKNNKIHTAAVIAGIPQDLKFKGEYTTVEIGDNNIIRECVTINRGTAAKGKTVVGNNNLIMAYVHIGHDCEVGNYVVLVNRVSLGGEVEVGDWAIIGGHSAIHQFCRIGTHSMLSGGSLINKDVPPFVKGAHYPVSFVGANYIGLRRRGFTSDQVAQIQETFRLLFQMGYGYGKACDLIEAEIPQSEERDAIIGFVRSSKRGIIKPFNPAKEGDEVE